jgi:hypothetical protein
VGDDARIEFWSTIAGLLRRKRVVVAAVLVGLTLGYVAYSGTPPTYASSSTMILTTTEYGGSESQDPTEPMDLTNPMLNFNDSLRTTAGILIQVMSTKSVANQLGVGGPTQLIVNDGRTNPDLLGLNGPFLYIEAMSTSAAEAKRVVEGAQTRMRQELRDRQHALNAPQKTFISLVDVVPPNAPVPDHGRGTKLALIAFLFGFLLCLGIAYFAERRAARRRARAAAVLHVVDTTPPPDRHPRSRFRRPSPAPVVVAAEDDEPAVVSTPLEAEEADAPAANGTAPAVVSTPLEAEEADAPAANGTAPIVVSTPLEAEEADAPAANGREHGVVPTPLRKAERAAVPPSVKNPNLAVAHAPVKQKARSRNR